MTAVQVYSGRGRLSYIPDQHFETPDTPPRLFQGRNRRPHRIHIASVAADLPIKIPRKPTLNIIVDKLAGPRENAKRFLRTLRNSQPGPDKRILESSSRPSSRNTVRSGSSSSTRSQSNAREDIMRSHIRDNGAGPIEGIEPSLIRPRMMDTAYSGSSGSSVAPSISPNMPEIKPLASGNGISVGISLAEPVLFLQGFEHSEHSERNTAMLRGHLRLRVQKSAKIKTITLMFRGRAITKWPEGIPPKKVEFEEVDTIMRHTWPFFNAQFPSAEGSTGADHVEIFKSSNNNNSSSSLSLPIKARAGSEASGKDSLAVPKCNLSSREQKRLSLQVNQSRSFGKGESPTTGPSVSQKGYKTFHPGDYLYNFELPLDSHLPETIDVELGSVKYELELVVERAGAFKANLMGTQEVRLIRAPSENSLEQVEPIAISRSWDDQLHYDIVISGKSFPLGAQVPIAIKLTPLAKVQCHRIKVFVTENTEYFCHNKKVHRLEPTRKLQLFEKRSDSAPASTFQGSSMRILSGGGVDWDHREAAARGEHVPVADPTNLLGNLKDDASVVGPTEMELSVQLPSCKDPKTKEKHHKLHFDTTYSNIQVHHWIKIVMRLSKPDKVDPTKRRHFEISIDSPFHILSCLATQANTSLPAYTSPPSLTEITFPTCGCPEPLVRQDSSAATASASDASNQSQEDSNQRNAITSPGLTRPQAAHFGGTATQPLQRPIHMLRAPSFSPPGFDEEDPPPPLETPPPQYDTMFSPTTGLEDYFSRLAYVYDDDSDADTPSRVEVPLTPGRRANRSLDERRTWLPIGHPAG